MQRGSLSEERAKSSNDLAAWKHASQEENVVTVCPLELTLGAFCSLVGAQRVCSTGRIVAAHWQGLTGSQTCSGGVWCSPGVAVAQTHCCPLRKRLQINSWPCTGPPEDCRLIQAPPLWPCVDRELVPSVIYQTPFMSFPHRSHSHSRTEGAFQPLELQLSQVPHQKKGQQQPPS